VNLKQHLLAHHRIADMTQYGEIARPLIGNTLKSKKLKTAKAIFPTTKKYRLVLTLVYLFGCLQNIMWQRGSLVGGRRTYSPKVGLNRVFVAICPLADLGLIF